MVALDKNSSLVKGFVTVAAVFIILAGVKVAASIIVPFLLSLFIAIICNPLIAKASQYKIPKAISVIFVIVCFVFVALSLTGLVGKSLNELSQQLPQYRVQLKEQLVWLTELWTKYNIDSSNAVLSE